MWLDVDEMVRILEAGVNISSTAAFVTGHSLGDGERQRSPTACERGGASMFGTRHQPRLRRPARDPRAGVCDRIDKITLTETADSTGYDSPATEIPVGFGRPIDDPDLHAMTRNGTAVFEDAVHLVADALGVELDEIVCEAEYAQTTQDLDLGSWKIDAGCVAGVAASWQGRVGAAPSSTCACAGARARPSSPTGRSSGLPDPDRGPPTMHPRSTSSRRPTSRRRPSRTSWCSA